MGKLVCFILLILIGANSQAQRYPLFSQYMFDGLVINPAYAGTQGHMSASLLDRMQWTGINGAPTTQTFSINTPTKKDGVGLGLLIFNDKLGVYNNTGIFGNYAYRIKLSQDSHLSLGLSGGVSIINENLSKIQTTEPGDVAFSGNSSAFYKPNASVGLYYYTPIFYFGASLPMFISHTFNSSTGKYKLKNDFSNYDYLVNTGTIIKISNNFSIKPSLLFRYNSQLQWQTDLNANFVFNKFWIGASYRINDSYSALFELQATEQIKIGYSYDYPVSALKNFGNGSHEIIIQYNFVHKIIAKSSRFF